MVEGFGKDGIPVEADIWVKDISGHGPSEQAMKELYEKIVHENTFLQELGGKGGPSNPLEWFCDQSHIKFSLTKMKELAHL